MVYTAPRTWVTGELVTAAMLNQDVRDNVSFLANPPACRLRKSAVQSIPSGVWTNLTWNTEDYDTAAMHDMATNTERITIPLTGIYTVKFGVNFAVNATGFRAAQITVDVGTAVMSEGSVVAVTGNNTEFVIESDYKLTAGQFVLAKVHQNSGGALDYAGGVQGFFSATWIGLG